MGASLPHCVRVGKQTCEKLPLRFHQTQQIGMRGWVGRQLVQMLLP